MRKFIIICFMLGNALTLFCQINNSSGIAFVIEKIKILESNKDPKCYATANRLEDFMYGTPLDDEARDLKIEIQKELVFYLRKNASERAASTDTIRAEHLSGLLKTVFPFNKTSDGSILFQTKAGEIHIPAIDLSQYASVAYSYRSLLSVEQDLPFLKQSNLLPLGRNAIALINDYLNIVTLVTLKLADKMARENNSRFVTAKLIAQSWIKVLEAGKDKALLDFKYPKLKEGNRESNSILNDIIAQKIASYEKYNELNTKIFLRNVQVFFAKQKWPMDQSVARDLKNYYLESLIAFATELIKETSVLAAQNTHQLIRVGDVQKTLPRFLPVSVNLFEDVRFFPNHGRESIVIESYDLDAFRDGGIHWAVLKFAYEDLRKNNVVELDPNAAELVVEAIAQMGVLVFRIAGAFSHTENKSHLTIPDIENAFREIQNFIITYPEFLVENKTEPKILSAQKSTGNTIGFFEDVTTESGILFEHKSSDWLSRLIRSFVVSKEENTIKMAIPPAFGGSGVAAEDLNNDNLADILILGGQGNKLFLNRGNGTFKDVTESGNINNWDADIQSYGEPRQPIVVDFNNDGFQDVFIVYVNDMHALLKNVDGQSFEDVTHIANLNGSNAVAGPATVLDFDNDGLLDIFIGYFGNYINGVLPTLSRDNQNGMPNKLYRNMGNFIFKEVPFTADDLSNRGWTQAVGHADINQDGLQDIIVGNDFGLNKYYLNTEDNGFVEMSKNWKTDKPSYTMNIGISDLNRDQFPDFYISNIVVMQKEEKYVGPNKNTTMKFDRKKMGNIRTVEANDLFISHAEEDVLLHYNLSENIGRGYASTGWSWDADFFDYDNDGDDDLYCLNGMNDFRVYSTENPFYFAEEEASKNINYAESNKDKNVFFVNENGKLLDKAEALGTDLFSNSRSAAYLDYDLDGDLDIIINNYHGKAVFLENKNENKNNWIKIKLKGSPDAGINLDAIGASIILNSEDHKNQWKEIHSTTGYLSVHPKVQHFGLGKNKKATATVKWPNGKVFVFPDLNCNEMYEISYPSNIKVMVD